ncbi:MAG: hypothetical protein ACYTGV_11930 [Planctomycetota bacterium]|jgi:hypothetical protein
MLPVVFGTLGLLGLAAAEEFGRKGQAYSSPRIKRLASRVESEMRGLYRHRMVRKGRRWERRGVPEDHPKVTRQALKHMPGLMRKMERTFSSPSVEAFMDEATPKDVAILVHDLTPKFPGMNLSFKKEETRQRPSWEGGGKSTWSSEDELALLRGEVPGALQDADVIDAAQLEELGRAVQQIGGELEELRAAVTMRDEDEAYGYVWTILGVAGIVSISKRIEGKLNTVQRKLNRLTRKIERAEQRGRSRRANQMLTRARYIGNQVQAMRDTLEAVEAAVEPV